MTLTSNIFAAPTPRYFTINPGRVFLRDLAQGIKTALKDDPLALSQSLIITPTRRAARALGEEFRLIAAQEGRGASLLPEIKPLGDVDEDALSLSADTGFIGDIEDEAALPPAISTMERKLFLAQMVAAKDRAFAGQENWVAALAAAGELAKLLDSFYTEEIDFTALQSLTPEIYAAHWAQSLTFLEIITEAWPAHLNAIDRMDPSARRAALINAQAQRWAATPPERPIIIAGTTGSAPAVARMMKIVAQLPKGAVVLPGLAVPGDTGEALLDERGWATIDDPHPQAGLKALLEFLQCAPNDIRIWPLYKSDHATDQPNERNALLTLALRPAAATDDWRDLVAQAQQADPDIRKSLQGLSLVEAEDEEAEAAAIALEMRASLQTPNETALLVTPDRDLTRRVALKMRRWNVQVDDSAGVPFHNTSCGTYLRLVAEWLSDQANPCTLIALARHSRARFGLENPDRAAAIDALDEAMRGLTPAGKDVGALEAKINDNMRESVKARALLLSPALYEAAAHWPQGPAQGDGTKLLSDFITAHLLAAEHLALDGEATQDNHPLWRGADGEAGARIMADLIANAPAMAITAREYPALITNLISGETVRPPGDAHPRVLMLGPLEARLQHADKIILSGLNEGVWPADAPTDPFLSRDMRRKIGLPSPERRIGLAAHDFAQLAAHQRVILTRATRAGGAPAKPSRWILRLKNILTGAGALPRVDETARLAAFAKSLDQAGTPAPAAAPNVKPPVEARPTVFSVTRISQLMRDPYGVYARQILRLRPLDPLGTPFASRHLGELLHRVFERHAGGEKQNLRALFDDIAPTYGYTPAHDAFWRGAIDDALAWFEMFHAQSLTDGGPAILEDEGRIDLSLNGATFTLTARADRIDQHRDGSLTVYDYKSQTLPSVKQIKADFSPQLPLTALIAEQGGFENIKDGAQIAGFFYLRMLNRHKNTHSKNQSGVEGAAAKDAVREAAEGLRALLEHFYDPQTPYLSQPRPEFTDEWGDYDHLARRREWRAPQE